MDKRVEWIDFAKGIAIFLVVLGHIAEKFLHQNIVVQNCNLMEIVHVIIYSFHMPLFFMMSGMVFSDEKYSSFQEILKRKISTLLVPSYLFVAIIIIKQVLSFMNLKQSMEFDLTKLVRTILQFRVEVIANFWFLPTLFWTTIIMWCIHKTMDSSIGRLIMSIIISSIGAVYIYNIKTTSV